jgi:hypothetical protein
MCSDTVKAGELGARAAQLGLRFEVHGGRGGRRT